MNILENKNIAKQLISSNVDLEIDTIDDDATKAKLEARKKVAQSSVFKEREVDSLYTLIYGEQKEDGKIDNFGYSDMQDNMTDITSNMTRDTFRFDVNHLRLERYKQSNFKKLLKKKFVTGQNKDKILENLINMSDSDHEGKDEAGNAIDKEQLHRIEDNDRRGTK